MSLITLGLGFDADSSYVSEPVYIQEPGLLSYTYGNISLSAKSDLLGVTIEQTSDMPQLVAFSSPLEVHSTVIDLRPSIEGTLI